MKKILLLLLMCVGVAAPTYGASTDELFEDDVPPGLELVSFIPHFQKILKASKVRTFLEFGPTDATKFFLEKCNKVISVEFVTHGYGPGTIKRLIGSFADYSNWIPIVYFSGYQSDTNWAPYKYLGSENVYRAASYQTSTHQNYALLDDFYTVELGSFIASLVRYNKVDVAFVNPVGVYLRGDIVQALFGKVPVIVGNDTNGRTQENDLCGFSRVITPEDYEEIFIPDAGGTTVWVAKKDAYKKLTSELWKYANSL